MFIISVCFAKLSLVAFIRNFTRLTSDRRSGLVIGLLVALWATTTILTVAFQCRLPEPWDYVHQSCFNRVSGHSRLVSDESHIYWNRLPGPIT